MRFAASAKGEKLSPDTLKLSVEERGATEEEQFMLATLDRAKFCPLANFGFAVLLNVIRKLLRNFANPSPARRNFARQR